MKKVWVIVLGVIVIFGIILGIAFFNNHPAEEIVSEEDATIATSPETGLPDSGIQEQDPVKLREQYKQSQEMAGNEKVLEDTKKKLDKINMDILFSPQVDGYSTTYVVQPNDALIKIARKFNTTVNLIKRANGLKSDIIRPGDKLKVATCKFSIVVDKSQNVLMLKVGDEIIKTYVVSTGKDNSTPIGTFKVVNKLEKPTWFKSGAIVPPNSPDNILGTRWLGFDLKGYGIHGTTEPEMLGKQVTLGCVRMKNEEVEELYDIVPTGTEVTIVD